MQNKKISMAYAALGKVSDLYDGMITNSSFFGRLAMKIFWGLSDENYKKFLNCALAGIPPNFSGTLLEIPVGTGAISLPVYKNISAEKIICVDYSKNMLAAAKVHAAKLNLKNVEFVQGDVANLPFAEKSFDILLTINGLHVFPEKEAAIREMWRVLKDGGIFCGSCYIRGQNWRTDFFVKNFCERVGYFSPPFETAETLQKKLAEIFSEIKISTVESFAGFICRR